jgi:hypothetical protein
MATTLQNRRDYFIEYCEFLMGREARDPAYRYWTNKRDPGPKYSSCGDLPHNLLWHVGCREFWVNVEQNGGFRYGQNINLLCPKPVGQNPHSVVHSERAFKPGDIILMCPPNQPTKWHTCIFAAFASPGSIVTYDFGQGPMGEEFWRGRSHVESRMKIRKEHEMHLRYVISLDDVEWAVEPILPSGEFFDFMEAWNG